MAKEAYFFSHDANARTDPKILEMRSVYKSEGYGWFWILVEMMREQETYELNMEGKYVWNAFALQMDTSAEKAKAFVEDCIYEFKLFESDGKKFWSRSLKERMKLKDEKSEKARKSAEARWNKPSEQANPMQTQYVEDANASKNDAIKEKKVKEINNIYTHWNSQQIMVHKALTDKMKTAINKALKNQNTEEEIKTAISNYAAVLFNDKYYFNYKWGLDEFLNRGLTKFLDWNICSNKFLKEKPKKQEETVCRPQAGAYKIIEG